MAVSVQTNECFTYGGEGPASCSRTGLPETQDQVGRVTKSAAFAYLAKTRLYQAYEQDDKNQVTKINPQRLEEVVTYTDKVIQSGHYKLFDDFADNFRFESENGVESVFAIQYSINDGTDIGRLNMGTGLNYNGSSRYGCCWFHVPSQNLVNAFRTGDDGLPIMNTFNNTVLYNEQDFLQNHVDPRIDHTAAIPGHPFKYGKAFVYNESFARAPQIYGHFGTMKELQLPDCSCFKKVGAFFGSSKNIDVIRYADVLLWRAEALIELGRQAEALPLINQIRNRAKNSTEKLKNAAGQYPSDYKLEPYIDGVNCSWTNEFARKALQWERRMEFAMEGYRFFDLVRWGTAAQTLNEYIAIEKTRHSFLATAIFTKGRDEYLQISQNQILLSNNLYTQTMAIKTKR
jgi:starch-binding outer membrane protein, SusD/RagB family